MMAGRIKSATSAVRTSVYQETIAVGSTARIIGIFMIVESAMLNAASVGPAWLTQGNAGMLIKAGDCPSNHPKKKR